MRMSRRVLPVRIVLLTAFCVPFTSMAHYQRTRMRIELGIYFCHFDGSKMEDEFAFSAYATLAEWKAKQRKFEEWSRKSERERQEASTTSLDPDDFEIPF